MSSFYRFSNNAIEPYYRLETIYNFSTVCFISISNESLSNIFWWFFWHLKMADDGAVSDGSDIDDGDTEIGINKFFE